MPIHYKGSTKDVRALDAYLKLIRATGTVVGRLQGAAADSGITLPQLAVLDALFHVGPMSQRMLARKIMRSNANVTAMLDNMEEQGLVQRKQSTEDRRVTTVSLTRAGRQRFTKSFSAHVAQVSSAMSALTVQEQGQLAALCKKLGLAQPD